MRVVFLGTADFSVPSLSALVAAGHEVALAVTQPDRPGDRGRPAPRPVADAAAALGVGVLQPPRLRAPEAVAAVLALEPRALVVAAYGQILPPGLLDAVPLGGVNVHASLLPRWRGAAPIAAAIRHGDAETGVSIMAMEAGLDTGPVFATAATPIGERESAPGLGARLAAMGADLLVAVLAGLEAGTQPAPRPQDAGLATHAPRLTRADGAVAWGRHGAAEVDRMVRAYRPWPGVSATVAGAQVRLLEVEAREDALPSDVAPGTVLRSVGGSLDVATADGVLRVHRLQPGGGRPMDAAAYLRGRRPAPP